MSKFRVTFNIPGDIILDAEDEQEAREKFIDVGMMELLENTYNDIEIDDIYYEGE